ncbi:DUF402 domain-containing protein [Bacillus thuringiensis]|nr:DUF402 domain-containing protein [Bacillus thuringiensis]
MCNIINLPIQIGKKILQRKIRYNSTIEEYNCKLLHTADEELVLFHRIEETFTMKGAQYELTIPKDAYTLAYFWEKTPYNLYIWRDKNGSYLGSYFNIVKNTIMTDKIVSFEDLIIDILIYSNGEYFILDEDELPVPLNKFENGCVYQSLQNVINKIEPILEENISRSEKQFSHKYIISTLYND